MNELIKLFNIQEVSNISVGMLITNMVIAFLISKAISIHFKKFGSTISNRDEFSQIFTIMVMTTLLIITIVKSSLALSLGLVGALSIVRFRTPIKEPEELAYLFLCIAAGLGLGANQSLVTVISILLILLAVTIYKGLKNSAEIKGKNIYLTATINNQNVSLSELIDILSKEALKLNIRRTYVNDKSTQATFIVEYRNILDLDNSISEFKKKYKDSEITFVDQSQLPGV